ncbi:MAG: glycosyltransferase family 4 protein, partial [Synergistaceae bacterium]|nr:glycosyltransferase family 4 protein [Synergistaceae bacterium]
MNNSPVRVHFDMQSVGVHCGMAVYETELALRLMKYDDLNISASYFLPSGEDRYTEQFSFPVKRVKIPTPLVYNALPVGKRKLLHAAEKPIFWILRPFLSYDFLVKDTGNDVYVFFENRVPIVPVKGKIIAVVHDVRSLRFEEVNKHREIITLVNTEDIIRKADLIITVSEFTKKELTDIFRADSARIEVVYNGVDGSAFAGDYDVSKYSLPEKYILYFGSCDTHKNVGALVKSYALLPAELRQEYQLVITNPTDSVKACAEACGISGQVQYLYRVPDEDKAGIYRGASLFVWPSLYEGFGIPILEAQASGVPVVCSDAGVMPEVTGDSAMLFDPKDTEGIASAIQRVLTDEGLRRDLVQRGFEN